MATASPFLELFPFPFFFLLNDSDFVSLILRRGRDKEENFLTSSGISNFQGNFHFSTNINNTNILQAGGVSFFY